MLVKLQHGTVRYRFKEDEKSPGSREERVEYPHEGPERQQKHGYFFHSRLQDFSESTKILSTYKMLILDLYKELDETFIMLIYSTLLNAQTKSIL